MPVVLPWYEIDAWMTGETPESLLRPVSDDTLRQWAVSDRVNKANEGDDDPGLILPVDEGGGLGEMSRGIAN